MELEQDPQAILASLLQQNTELRLEYATLQAQIADLTKELDIQRQMRESQNIPPHVLEMLSKLDIR